MVFTPMVYKKCGGKNMSALERGRWMLYLLSFGDSAAFSVYVKEDTDERIWSLGKESLPTLKSETCIF